MTKAMVEDIRVKLASGLYDEGQLFLGLSGKLSKVEFESIVSYEVLPEVCKDLHKRIQEVVIARGLYISYQGDLQKEFTKSEAAELSGAVHAGFSTKKWVLDELLAAEIAGLVTIKLEELRKFYP